MLCPYCVTDIGGNAASCSQCNKEIPEIYRTHYPRATWLRRPTPLLLSVVGFSGHGKTVYLAALLHTLEAELTKVWKGFYRQGLDRDSILTVRDNLQLLEQRRLPESTRQNFPAPSIHRLAKIPQFGDKVVIIYDTSGEAFEDDLRIEQYAHFVKRSRCVFFLVSLDDLADPLPIELHRLLNVYTMAMERMHSPTKQQHLVVVFTKADLLPETRLRHYPEVVRHLSTSSYVDLHDLQEYRRRLEQVSQELADFTNNGLEARGFVNLARDAFKSVAYCAVSALGSAPEGIRLRDAMTPIRVVDPLIWLLARE